MRKWINGVLKQGGITQVCLPKVRLCLDSSIFSRVCAFSLLACSKKVHARCIPWSSTSLWWEPRDKWFSDHHTLCGGLWYCVAYEYEIYSFTFLSFSWPSDTAFFLASYEIIEVNITLHYRSSISIEQSLSLWQQVWGLDAFHVPKTP
jgi:hypothetical protein